ncbi:hypothetical protein H4S08_004277 [Coemansia sp. RSA 1365]|nr:hypothetical protein H4S08_004277 [Coemansia sp. RSA 1365]
MAVTRKQQEQKGQQQQSANVPAARKVDGVGTDDDKDAYIVRNEQGFDADGMVLGMKATQQEQLEATLGSFSAGLTGAYILGHGSPGMGGLSPAWSGSTASNNDDAGLAGGDAHGLMFPTLAAARLEDDAEGMAMADAALDGWLQQFVNTDVLGSAVDDAAWSASMPASDASTTVAPTMETLSPDVLATFLASGGACPTVAAMLPGAASQLSMLAALPFPQVAAPTNIAPQKTLSAVPVTPEPAADLPPPCKVRRQQQPQRPKAGSPRTSFVGSPGGENAASLSADHSPGSSRAEVTASSASVKRSGGSSTHSTACQPFTPRRPLAPRQAQVDVVAQQPQTQQQQRKVGGTKGASGAITPPGLSVLAKIAQKQTPIAVSSSQCSAAEARKPLSQTPATLPQSSTKQANPADTVAQKRQERLIKNRAAALLSRKRKRDYMTRLESEVEELRESNSAMAKRLAEMERRLGALAAERDRLAQAGTASSMSTSTEPQQPETESEQSGGTSEPSTVAAEPGTSASDPPSKSNSGGTPASPTESMDIDSEHAATTPYADSVSEAEDESDSDNGEPRLRPRVASAADAPEAKQQAGGTGKQRTAGALLMAVLFSFSLFSFPALHSSDQSVAVGGSGGGGLLPAPEPRLLIAAAPPRRDAGFPLAERVRRSISAFAHPQDDGHAQASAPTNTSFARPMTIQESAGLRAWINRGLVAEPRAPAKQPSALSVVRHQDRTRPDHAMLYCPTMKHVLFSSAEQQITDTLTPADSHQPAAARVLDSRPTTPSITSLPAANDVDDCAPADLAAYATPDATGEPSIAHFPRDVAALPASERPKLSLYSPVVSGAAAAVPNILPPWEEFARLDAPDDTTAAAKQKYLRIDVEVVGSKWVTADKFANGLY